MGVGKKIMIVFGVICIVLSVAPLIFSIIATVTYIDGVGVVDDKEKERDRLEDIGQPTGELDKQIEDDKDLLATKRTGMAICYPITFVLLLVGILLLIIGSRPDKKR